MSQQSEETSKTKRHSWGENKGLIDGKKEGHGEIQYTVHVHMDIRRRGIGKEREGGRERQRKGEIEFAYTCILMK